ncbi:MAG: immune inhibitor A [Anaerolineae bacterium]|nr:immune inhibitor A [Anaerolineae bacterium]
MRWIVIVVLLSGVVLPLGAPPSVFAQDGKGTQLTWDDAPIVPRYRSHADWLYDMGLSDYEEVYGPFLTHEYRVGDVEQFIPLGSSKLRTEVFSMQLATEHAYFWFERGVQVDPAKLEYTARFFEEHIWPLNNSIYGDEWNPGIDGDSRIHIISQIVIGSGIYGAFDPEDQCPRSLCPDSNQREIIYLSLDEAPLGSPEYLTTLAHEHQHLIQYHVDGNERRWFNEGLSQLAEHLNGFHPRYVGAGNLVAFLSTPDHRLDGWSFDFDIGRYYGASYLFMVYLYERLGLDFIRAVAANDYDGLASVQQTLKAEGYALSVDDVFADWIIANLLDDPLAGDGRYYYQTLDLPDGLRPRKLDVTQGGIQIADTVNQYGADYYTLTPGSYQLSFDGSDQAAVLDVIPPGNDLIWWSYNAISSAARLTAELDLSGLDAATLAFRAWWEIEDGYDWFQVLVSDNGGAEWAIVGGEAALSNGENAPGAFYSGQSFDWLDETIDLSDYAGSHVLVRFEYLTDQTQTLQGVALNDMRIVELGDYNASIWMPEGFLHVPGAVSQNWAVTVVRQTPDGRMMVTPLVLDDANTGGMLVVVPEGGTATLVIGAMAPFTPRLAQYKLALRRAS